MNTTDVTDLPPSIEKGKDESDFYTLTKMKRQERKKCIFFITAVLLSLAMGIAFFIIILQYNKHESKVPKIVNARAEAYKRIAKYGEDCSKDYRCGKHAFCHYLQGTYRCDCIDGFYGNGIGDCKSGYFGIDFKRETTKNFPVVKNINFPKSDEMSICFWMFLKSDISSNKVLFSYVSHDSQGENVLMIWLKTDNTMTVSFRGQEIKISQNPLIIHSFLNKWNHFCWVWNFQKSWELYVNAILFNNADNENAYFKESFPANTGDVILGQAIKNGKFGGSETSFVGMMTEFFIYDVKLTSQQIKAAYESYPHDLNIIVGWWQFKNLSKGTDIIETKYPFSRKFFISSKR